MRWMNLKGVIMSKEEKSFDEIYARLDAFFERQNKNQIKEIQERIDNAKEETPIDESCKVKSTEHQPRNPTDCKTKT